MVREVVFHPSTLLSMKTQFPKGVIPYLNSSSFSMNSFVLFPSQTFCNPSHSIILHSSTDFATTHFDIKILFKTHLCQSVRHSSCEVGHISHFHKFKGPSPHLTYQYILHGLYDFIEIMFDDYCRYIFDPSGTQLQLLWALKKPFDLRLDPLQEGGDDVISTRLITWANIKAHSMAHMHLVESLGKRTKSQL